MFDPDSRAKIYDFGWWPEVVGMGLVGLIVWFLFTFADGTL